MVPCSLPLNLRYSRGFAAKGFLLMVWVLVLLLPVADRLWPTLFPHSASLLAFAAIAPNQTRPSTQIFRGRSPSYLSKSKHFSGNRADSDHLINSFDLLEIAVSESGSDVVSVSQQTVIGGR